MQNYCGWINEEIFNGEDYKKLLNDLEAFQFEFVGRDKNYKKGWIFLNDVRTFGSDLTSNWSRQYEYSYVAKNVLEKDRKLKVLDVGSGYSFFPFYLKNAGADVFCSDILNLKDLFQNSGVEFIQDDITDSKINESFDVVYSVSVFEHMPDKAKAIEHIHRLLKTGGKLVLTMDCDLNLSIDDAVPNYGELSQIVSLIENKFKKLSHYDLTRDQNMVTTEAFFTNQKWRLPWKDKKELGWKGVAKKVYNFFITQRPPSIGVFVGVWEKK